MTPELLKKYIDVLSPVMFGIAFFLLLFGWPFGGKK